MVGTRHSSQSNCCVVLLHVHGGTLLVECMCSSTRMGDEIATRWVGLRKKEGETEREKDTTCWLGSPLLQSLGTGRKPVHVVSLLHSHFLVSLQLITVNTSYRTPRCRLLRE